MVTGVQTCALPIWLDPRRTFSTLVEGSANRMARAAAMHVANAPGQLYNPLFIYGGVGLGKTHLMHATGNRLQQLNPQARVLYIHAEQFVSDVVRASMNKNFESIREKYHSLDLLIHCSSIERQWFKNLLNLGLTDSLRQIHPEGAFYT